MGEGHWLIVNFGICLKHKAYRLIKIFIGFIFMIMPFILIFWFSDEKNRAITIPIGILLIIIALFYLISVMPILKITVVDSKCIHIKGCDKSFLESLTSR